MSRAAQPRVCPWCFGTRKCRDCDGRGLLNPHGGDPATAETACGVCAGTGRCSTCNNHGQFPLDTVGPLPDDASGPRSAIHKLLRLHPGAAPHCLCSSQRFGGGTLLDGLAAILLLSPLVVIAMAAQSTHWVWLMLLCLPAAYFVAVFRREFESEEWRARDQFTSAVGATGPANVELAADNHDQGRFLHRGVPASRVSGGMRGRAWMAHIARGTHHQVLCAATAITECIDDAPEDWPRPHDSV